jgi:hypothetical protein
MTNVVVFTLGRHEVGLTRIDANEIRGRAVERTLAAEWLYDALARALDDESDRADVIVKDEAVRYEILIDLEAIRQEHPLTEGQQRLWEVAQAPILP